jgi:hypothetical protein
MYTEARQRLIIAEAKTSPTSACARRHRIIVPGRRMLVQIETSKFSSTPTNATTSKMAKPTPAIE